MAESNGNQITTDQVDLQKRVGFAPWRGNGAGHIPKPSDFEIVSDPAGTRLASEVPEQKPRPGFWKRNRKWFILAAIMAAVIWATVRFGVPRIREALDTVSTDDAFVAGHVTNVSPRIDDVVIGVLVDQNDRVEPGQLLIRMDRQPFEVAVAQAEAAARGDQGKPCALTGAGAGAACDGAGQLVPTAECPGAYPTTGFDLAGRRRHAAGARVCPEIGRA